MCVGISARVLIIERLKYLNLEISTGRLISTKENISIRCRINPSEEHTWHTMHSQLNLIVDLIHNFYITWGKRQDNLDQKFESLLKEHNKLVEKYAGVNNKIDLVLQKLEESKGRNLIICKNNDYIKEEVLSIGKNLSGVVNKNKDSLSSAGIRHDILEVKRLIQEVKTLVVS